MTNTGRLIPAVPGALIEIAPENGPLPAGNALGFTVTCKLLGKAPEPGAGVTESQLPVPLVKALAVIEVTLELLLDTDTCCVTSEVLLAGIVKLREFGLTTSGLAPPCVLAFKTTGMVRLAPGDAMLINPVSVPEVGADAPMETVSDNGVFPVDGVTTNQLFAENALTVTLADDGAEVTKTL